MRCIPASLVQKLASLFSLKELSALVDPKDKLESRLYQFKVIEILKKSDSDLMRCLKCSKIIAKKFLGRLRCDRNEPRIDVIGRIEAMHQM
jgi:uncharacterized protein with PIN domain